MKTIKLFLKISKFIFIGVLAVALLFNVVSIFKSVILKEQVPLVLGFGNAVIVTGSMEPAIMPGDMIIVRKQKDYEVSDIVTYRGNNHSVTHRIMEKTASGFITQGDANNTDDGEIDADRMIGKVVKIIPQAGKVIVFLRSPPGMLLLIAGLFTMIEAPRLIGKIRRDFQANRNGKHVER